MTWAPARRSAESEGGTVETMEAELSAEMIGKAGKWLRLNAAGNLNLLADGSRGFSYQASRI
ncbi:MAG: hypothetical protein CFE26_11500 [Verrucomicrobiales bacterium VVV1]|nr:MAG: hypothetical protein CFE26_11500 [Verrucomicrobiales bacterium VVV1]